jgi:hypothetical protein
VSLENKLRKQQQQQQQQHNVLLNYALILEQTAVQFRIASELNPPSFPVLQEYVGKREITPKGEGVAQAT